MSKRRLESGSSYPRRGALLRSTRGRGKVCSKRFPRHAPQPKLRCSSELAVAWILRVARNAALDHLRARRQIPFEEIRTSDEGHEQIGFDRWQCLKEALDRLSSEQREVLVLRHIAGLTPAEIAGLLDKTEGSVHGLHHRGRGALQGALRELGRRRRPARRLYV